MSANLCKFPHFPKHALLEENLAIIQHMHMHMHMYMHMYMY